LSKYHDTNQLVNSKDYDIFCISESCLKKGQAFAPSLGYSCLRNDGDFKCRGVAILHKVFLKANVIDLCIENISGNIDLLCVKFQLGYHKSIIVVVIYRHPDYTKLTLKRDYESFENIISSLQLIELQYFIVGDFNLRESYISPLLRTNFNLMQIVEKATRMNNLLDLIICPSAACILSHNVFDAGLADHSVIDVSFALLKPKPVKKIVAFRQFSRIDPSVLLSDISLAFNELPTSSVSLSLIQQTIISIFDKLAPLKSKSFYPKEVKKFVSSATRAHISDRESAYQSYLRNSSNYNRLQHSRLKKIVKRGIINDTRIELDDKIKARGTWGGIKSVYALKSRIGDEITLSPNEINDYFVNISMPSSSDLFNDY
jgi:hypothetical protein